ncbi:MAG: hypothetical protein ACTSXL_04575, partial [Alphaproteobacteria bacterium]
MKIINQITDIFKSFVPRKAPKIKFKKKILPILACFMFMSVVGGSYYLNQNQSTSFQGVSVPTDDLVLENQNQIRT